MQNGAKETDRQENAAGRVIPAYERRKEKARRTAFWLLRANRLPQIFVGKGIYWFIGLLMP